MGYDINEIFGSYTHNGVVHHYVDEDAALAHLLLNDVVFSNGRKYVTSFKDEPIEISEKSTTICFVSCNDIFAWGCADGEELPHSEIGNLFKMWHEDKNWGAAKWCAIQRNQKPQPPIIEDMKKNGSWDEQMEALGENFQDAETQAIFASLSNRI